MKSARILLLAGMALSAQTVKTGVPAPPIVAQPLDASRPFPGWQAYRGNFVVVARQI